jgi:hypothetical protein
MAAKSRLATRLVMVLVGLSNGAIESIGVLSVLAMLCKTNLAQTSSCVRIGIQTIYISFVYVYIQVYMTVVRTFESAARCGYLNTLYRSSSFYIYKAGELRFVLGILSVHQKQQARRQGRLQTA